MKGDNKPMQPITQYEALELEKIATGDFCYLLLTEFGFTEPTLRILGDNWFVAMLRYSLI